jgi:DNA (cytosine-5)-methyltransferase 1
MSWLFSQALVEEFSEAICLDGEQSVQSSGSNTPQAYCAPDKMTGFSRLSRFGMTFKPLTETRGEELLTLYRAGFPAKTYLPLGGGGIDGERSGMWREMARIICEVQPRFVFVENSPILTSRGLGRVLGDLAQMGFDAKWGVLGADCIGLPHRRERIWLLATNPRHKYVERGGKKAVLGKPRIQSKFYNGVGKDEPGLRSILSPGLCRTFNGLPGQVDRIKAIGNAQVPRVAATAWRILSESL